MAMIETLQDTPELESTPPRKLKARVHDGEDKNLATMDLRDAAKELVDQWKRQDAVMKRRAAEWQVNDLRRKGVTGVRVTKDKDRQIWKVWAPPGAAPILPTLNKADRLCRRLVAHLFADPPTPEATPGTDSDEDRTSSELSTRVLIDLGSEANLGNELTARLAADISCTYGSGFRRFYVDPTAGGWQPVAVQASPHAQALRIGDDGQLVVQDGIVDPATGLAYPPPYVRRYVLDDGTLTDKEHAPGVRRQWRPKLRSEVLPAPHVRFLPITARDISEAEGVMVASLVRLGDLKRQFPDMAKLKDDDLQLLSLEIGESEKDLLPPGLRAEDLKKGTEDNHYTRVITCYYVQSPSYKNGLYLITAGDGLPVLRSAWVNPHTQAPLDLPLDQFKQLDDGNDPYGRGLMHTLGAGNEMRAASWATLIEHMDKLTKRRILLPYQTNISPKELQTPTATVLYYNAAGKPVFEDVPPFPQPAVQMAESVTAEMDDESGLQTGPAQGQTNPNVQSALHHQRIVEQVQVGLSSIRQNYGRALERGWRIQLQQLQAFYDVPQIVSWVGDDGAHKVREWVGTDLSGTKDVRILRGSFTGLSPSSKAALAESFFNMRDPQSGQGLLSLQELKRIVIGNVGGLLGAQDDPHWQRIRRQIDAWKQGPSQDQEPEQEPQLGPDGQPIPAPPSPEAAAIWVPVPTDDDPEGARLRYHELGRLISSVGFQRFDESWQVPVVAEYQRMRQAAGIQTIAEQQQAQQQQAEAAQQAQTQAMEQQAAAGQQAEAQKAEERNAKLEGEKVKAAAQVETERIRAEAGLQASRIALAGHQANQDGAGQSAGNLQETMVRLAEAMKPVIPPIPAFPPVTVVVASDEKGLQAVVEKVGQPARVTLERDKKGKLVGATLVKDGG